MKTDTPLVLFVVLLRAAANAALEYREGRFAPRHPERVPPHWSRSWSCSQDHAGDAHLTRYSVFPEPALRLAEEPRQKAGERGPLGAPSSPRPAFRHSGLHRGAGLADRISYAVWRQLGERQQMEPRLRSLLMVRAARCANSGPSTPSPLVTRRNLGPNPFWS